MSQKCVDRKLALSGLALLGLSVCMILFSKLAVNDLAYRLLLSSDFASVDALNAYTFTFSVLGYFFMAVGACLFVYLGVSSRFRVDRQRLQGQTRKLRLVFVAVACGLVVISLFSASFAQGNSMATTGYYLATPYSPYDWLIARYSTGTVYALNGSNWANMMTWPSTAPWASYAGNNSAVVEAALAATSAGTLYLKEVAFDYGLTIPDNVQVTENVNGLTRTFVSSSDTQGSPYTISVDTVNSTYYLAQDGAGRYIDSWTSTNKTAVLANVTNDASVGSTVSVQSGVLSAFGSASLIVANVSASTSAGQVVYRNLTNQYSLAISNATSTLGYGDCNIAIVDAIANAKCLLLKDGYFTLASWDWDAGWVYVSNSTAGALVQTPHEASGEPDLTIGTVIANDTIKTVPLILIEQP